MPKTESRLLNATRIAFLNCNDAKLHVIDACLTEEQAARLRGALAWLEECGLVLVPQSHADGGVTLFDGVVERLAASVGSLSLNAALSCQPTSPPRQGVKPAAVMPVWPLERDTRIGGGRDLLISSARLWGADLLIEALRVEDPDHPVPVRALRTRFDRWVRAAGGARLRSVINPPGEGGCYVLTAMSAPR